VIFTRDEAANVRAGKQTSKLIPASHHIRPNTVRPLRRNTPRHDPDGNPTGTITATVQYIVDDQPKPVILTITTVRQLHLDQLELTDAQACGYRTIQALKDAWQAQHPRTTAVKLITFAVGDIRDIDQYLNQTNAGGDYTSNRHRALAGEDEPVLTQAQLAPLTKMARERDRERARTPIQRERDQIVQSLDNIEEILRTNPNRDVRRTVRSLRNDLVRLDQKLKAA
jgi:hypothetical protein